MFTLCLLVIALAAAIYVLQHIGEILAMLFCLVFWAIPVLLFVIFCALVVWCLA